MFSMKDTNGNICFPKVILLIKGSYLYINTYRVIIDNVELVESVCKNDTSKLIINNLHFALCKSGKNILTPVF